MCRGKKNAPGVVYLCPLKNSLLYFMALHISNLNHCLSTRYASDVDDLHPTEPRWFAVRTSARHEKRASNELQRAGIECYVPLRERVYNYASKQTRRQLPLLTGYAFVRIRKAEETIVLRASSVSRFVKLGPCRRRVSQAEIDLLKTLSADRVLDWETVEEAFNFEEGTPVEIIKGPLVGVRGYYQHKKNKKTFVISLGSLHTCLSTCEVDPTFLVALDGQPLQLEESEGRRM